MRKFAESIDRCHFYRHRFCPKKKFGLLSSATERKLKNGFHHAKEDYLLDFSTYHSVEISGILPFRYRHEKAKREKKKDFTSRRILAESIDRCQFFRHWPWPKKKIFCLISSATKKILKTGFHHAKEQFEVAFSAYHSAEISDILPFRSRPD